MKSQKKKYNIILEICGSIAAYKICELIRRIKEKNFNVTCVMSDAAKKFITELTIQTLSEQKVYSDIFEPYGYDSPHISLANNTDIVVIAPATANTIAKLAHGFANDFISSIVLSTRVKILICPCMNSNMWLHRATQNNIKILKSFNYSIMEPEKGKLACGIEGIGRLPPVEKIIKKIEELLQTK